MFAEGFASLGESVVACAPSACPRRARYLRDSSDYGVGSHDGGGAQSVAAAVASVRPSHQGRRLPAIYLRVSRGREGTVGAAECLGQSPS